MRLGKGQIQQGLSVQRDIDAQVLPAGVDALLLPERSSIQQDPDGLDPRPSAVGRPDDQTVRVLLDGGTLGEKKSIHPGGEDLRVYITLNGETLLDLPFAEAHTVRIIQPDGGENTVTLTGTSVYMTEANCDGQDCVQMGEVTRDNLEVRVMGGFIICLPHKISVEVR
jgi:hypothetical protein